MKQLTQKLTSGEAPQTPALKAGSPVSESLQQVEKKLVGQYLRAHSLTIAKEATNIFTSSKNIAFLHASKVKTADWQKRFDHELDFLHRNAKGLGAKLNKSITAMDERDGVLKAREADATTEGNGEYLKHDRADFEAERVAVAFFSHNLNNKAAGLSMLSEKKLRSNFFENGSAENYLKMIGAYAKAIEGKISFAATTDASGFTLCEDTVKSYGLMVHEN